MVDVARDNKELANAALPGYARGYTGSRRRSRNLHRHQEGRSYRTQRPITDKSEMTPPTTIVASGGICHGFVRHYGWLAHEPYMGIDVEAAGYDT